MYKVDLMVDGLNCSGCVGGLTKRLVQVAGVTDVTIDLVPGGTSTAHVVGEHALVMGDLESAVTAAGKRLATPAGI